jgi:hypothetical protein
MKNSKTAFFTLIAELEGDLTLLAELFEKNRIMTAKIEKSRPDEFDYAALGYTIHNIYNLFENYFLRIAKFFENNLGSSAWHKELVDRMALHIEDMRPALLKREDLFVFHELRGFRHLFRNIYQSSLNVEKLLSINEKVPTATTVLKSAHTRFVDALGTVAAGLDE